MGVTVCAAIGLVLCMGCYDLTEERNAASRSVNAAPIRVSDIAVVLTKNRAVLALCIHGMLQGVLMSVSGSLGSWLVFRFVWNITPELREKRAKACQA